MAMRMGFDFFKLCSDSLTHWFLLLLPVDRS